MSSSCLSSSSFWAKCSGWPQSVLVSPPEYSIIHRFRCCWSLELDQKFQNFIEDNNNIKDEEVNSAINSTFLIAFLLMQNFRSSSGMNLSNNIQCMLNQLMTLIDDRMHMSSGWNQVFQNSGSWCAAIMPHVVCLPTAIFFIILMRFPPSG